MIEASRDDALALGVEVERDDLRRVAQEVVQAFAGLDVPQSRRVVHRSGGNHGALRVKGQADDLRRVPAERVEQLAFLRVPQLGRLVEAARHDLVSIRVVEGDGVHHVPMALQGQQLVAGHGVPNLARPIIAPGDKLVPALVEGAVREGQNVRPQDLEEVEVRAGLRLLLLDQLVNQAPELWLAILRHQRLFEDNLIHEHFDVGFLGQVQQVDFLVLAAPVAQLILQYDARRIVSQQEALQLHLCFPSDGTWTGLQASRSDLRANACARLSRLAEGLFTQRAQVKGKRGSAQSVDSSRPRI
mmetsp:Transcript_11960/g.44456  ORF Transcript_11960/g.44456 Transcript_11960/m.44456 type:complete len:301 (-) Transcript_11960:16-918(-)